jgi:chromosome segregation ATPase
MICLLYIQAELNRLQSRTTSDLESIRQTQREAFEREITGLKESRDHIAIEMERQRTAAESYREDLNTLQEEHRRLQSTLETERSDSRNALKLKSFDHERLSLTYEETLSDLRKLKIEHEIICKKLTLVKNELFTLQGESQKNQLESDHQIKNLTEKLSMYQQLEYELDMAILGAGGLQSDEQQHGGSSGASGLNNLGNQPGVRGIHSLLESLGSNIPTANKRRMKQSILLAQQLVEKQKQIDSLRKEVEYYKDRNNELDAELDAAKRALAAVSQPHSYLIQALQAKESELIAANKATTLAQRKLSEREEELSIAITARTSMEADLHRLLHGKNSLDGIKEALLRNQTKQIAQTNQLDQQFYAQQAGGSVGVGVGNFKENRPPFASSVGLPSFNDPRNHFPLGKSLNSGMVADHGGFHSNVAASVINTTSHPHIYPVQQQQLSSSHSRQQQQQQRATATGDAAIDAQPKPLWFRKLAQ